VLKIPKIVLELQQVQNWNNLKHKPHLANEQFLELYLLEYRFNSVKCDNSVQKLCLRVVCIILLAFSLVTTKYHQNIHIS
jgi:hypothetical protein